MTKNEMLTALKFQYGDPYVLESVVAVLKALIARLPDEAPLIEKGSCANTNVQD